MDRFPHLEVHRTVLDLQYHVVVKMAVEGHEIVVGGIGPVGGPVAPVLPAVVNETAPDDQAAVRLESGSQHVRTVGVVPAVCEGTGAELGVGLDEETSKIGYMFVYLSGLFAPPFPHPVVQGIGGFQAAQFDRA